LSTSPSQKIGAYQDNFSLILHLVGFYPDPEMSKKFVIVLCFFTKRHEIGGEEKERKKYKSVESRSQVDYMI
jgi:hypothetical protein